MNPDGQEEETRLHDHESARLPIPEPQLRLGIYRVDCQLGVGGMGRVYRGAAPDGTPVAIKLLRFLDEDLTECFRERFEHEGDLLEGIDHPNVVRLLDRGTNPETGLPFLVFEYLDGLDLTKVQKETPGGRLSLAEAVFVLERCARGLQALHERGIVHRDLKLGNVFVTPAGEVKLIDFGIATQPGEDVPAVGPEVVGTLSYMAPEVLGGSEGSPAGDVFALGNTVYRLLTGTRPFTGSTRHELLTGIHAGATPIADFRADVPEGLCTLIRRMLHPDAERRPTPAEVLIALRSQGLNSRTRRVAREWSRGHRGPAFVDED